MKRFFCIFVLVLCMLPSTCLGADISAKSAVVIDARLGKVLYEKNARQRMSMASTTKIMTALCALEEGNLDKTVTVDDRAVGVEGSSMYLTKGENLTLEELVYGLMLSSGNDAAVAIACAVSGGVEEFASLMNKKAEEIGAVDTKFKNPNGLDEEGHYTTAYDLALITAYAMKNDIFRKIVSTYQTTVTGPEGKRYLTNHNKLLRRMDGCIGVKTGFTKKSGRCLVSACERDGVTLVGVTLNAPDDWNDHIKMMDTAYPKIKLKNVFQEGDSLGSVSIKNGTKKKLDAVCRAPVDIPCTEGTKYVTLVKLPSIVSAPIKKGDTVATAEIYADGELIDTAEFVASVGADEVVERKTPNSFEIIWNFFLGK